MNQKKKKEKSLENANATRLSCADEPKNKLMLSIKFNKVVHEATCWEGC